MKAYHGKSAVKKKYLARVMAHRKTDKILQGHGYWRDGRGCAVGCTIHGSDHSAYEAELGIPRMIARLEDGIFEGLPAEEAKLWPEQFLKAIKPGQDLSLVGERFLHWLLVDPVDGVLRYAETEAQKKAIRNVADLYAKTLAGVAVNKEDWLTAAHAAHAAANAAYAHADAAYAAADAAYAAAYAAAHADAAYAAAYAAAHADARAAAYAAAHADARAAAYAAAHADARAASAAACAASRNQARTKQASKLLELLKSAPMYDTEC